MADTGELYVNINGTWKQLDSITVYNGGWDTPTLQDKTVTPTTSEQTVQADDGYDGLNKVVVGAIQTETKDITANGDYSPTTGKYFSKVNVNVPEKTFATQAKTATPSTSQQVIKPDTGYDGLSQVTIGAIKNQVKSVTPTNSQQTITPDTEYNGLSQVVVGAINNQAKTATPTNSEQTITPDSGYNGLSQVIIGAVNNQSKTATPKETEQTVTPDTGYNGLSQVIVEAIKNQSKTISPTTSEQVVSPDSEYNGLSQVTVSAILLQSKTATPTNAIQEIVCDDGYNGLENVTVNPVPTESKMIDSNGTYTPTKGKFFDSVTVDVQPTLQEKSVTPNESAQTITPDSGYEGLSKVNVGAVSSTYIGSDITKKSAQTYTPSTSNQTISAGQYLSGAQTIQGDSNLVAENIKSGVSIFGKTGSFTSDADAIASDILSSKTAYVNGQKITGTVVYQNYYSGNSAPSSSLGNDGDLYFQTV